MRETTLRETIKKSSEDFAHNNALSFVDSQPITYSELYRRIVAVAFALQFLGIKKGDKVAILSSNNPNWGITYLATLFNGAVVVPILNDFSAREVQNILNHSEAKVLFVSDNLKSKVLSEGYEALQCVINIHNYSLSKQLAGGENMHFAPDFGEESLPDNLEKSFGALSEEDLAAIIYTSGTTGTSKGVMLSHKNLISNIQCTSKLQPILPTDRLLSILPLAHTYECTLGFLMPLTFGGSVYYINGSPTASILMPALQKVRPTMMLTVPLIIEKIYKSKILPKFSCGMAGMLYKLPPFRKIFHLLAGIALKKTFGGKVHFFGIGGAMLDPATEKFLREARFPYAIGYGLTETSPLIAGSSPEITKFRSTGPCLEGQQLKLINVNPETGEGEIVAKGDNVMKGYYKNEELTRNAFTDDGWFKTGDLGSLDNKNRLYIKGRLKNMILGANGENIYPEEIEAVINRHGLVVESIVYQQKGRLVAMVHLDYSEIEYRYASLKVSARNLQSDMQQYVRKNLDEILLSVNSQVSKFSKLAVVIEQPAPFEKTPTHKIKKYLYTR
jgi:long-chain acyl-CoA synthetase